WQPLPFSFPICGAGDLSAAFSLRKNGRGVRVHAPLAMVACWRTPCIKRWPQYQGGRCVSSPLFGKAFVERTKIDDNSLVGSAASSMPSLADTLKSTRFPSTLTTSAVAHTSAYRRGGEVLYI